MGIRGERGNVQEALWEGMTVSHIVRKEEIYGGKNTHEMLQLFHTPISLNSTLCTA